MEQVYMIYVETPGAPEDEPHIYKCEVELTERQIINLGGLQVIIIEVVDRPRIGHVGLAEAEPFHPVPS
jgi:hypothetical protein